jgi:hypothetical protein
VRPANRRSRSATALALSVGTLLALVLASAACTPSNSASPSALDCPADIKAPGTFPNLEALLPRGMIEASPTTVDSGANCTNASLGSYRDHGIGELQFAGATWDYGNGNATVAAVLFARPTGNQPALDVAWVEEFYTLGALNGRNTDDITRTRPTMPVAGEVFRLEALNGLSLQTVVIWKAGPAAGIGQFVRVVIVATTVEPDASRTDHDERVRVAVEVAAGVPVP